MVREVVLSVNGQDGPEVARSIEANLNLALVLVSGSASSTIASQHFN